MRTTTITSAAGETSVFVQGTLRDWAEAMMATAVICALIAAGTQWLNDGNYLSNLWIALGFGLSICTGIQLAHAGGRRSHARTRTALGLTAGMTAGLVNLSWVLYASPVALFLAPNDGASLLNILFSLGVSLLVFTGFYAWYRLQKLQLQAQINARQLAERDRALATSELRALQSQIEPHFLFNTLANIEALVETDATLARTQLRELSALLRRSLQRSREDTTTLGEELDMIEHYLRLQQMRLGDRLTYTIACDSELRTLAFPPLLVQPLVENAIRHGIEPATEGGPVRLDLACPTPDTLRIQVTNPAPQKESGDTPARQGLGLDNIRERLEQLFGSAARLDLTGTGRAETVATLTLPLQGLTAFYSQDAEAAPTARDNRGNA